MFKLSKALYGLNQAYRSWYEKLSKFLSEKGFNRWKVDTTLFIKVKGHDILVVQIYVDDIIFDATNESLCQEFSKVMQGEFEISMMGELTFLLGLQVKKTKRWHLNQSSQICQGFAQKVWIGSLKALFNTNEHFNKAWQGWRR